MSDDFLRLVSQANPASREYQPANNNNNGYHPSTSVSGPYANSSDPQLLDPFFDDDDDMPDSAFGRPMPMESQESGLPLARSAAPPAGVSKVMLGDGVPQGWNFDDDDLQTSNQRPFQGSHSFPGQASSTLEKSPRKSKKRAWRWPWQREKVLEGERVVALNNRAANAEFISNYVSTSKYNMITFVPKFLAGAFRIYTWTNPY